MKFFKSILCVTVFVFITGCTVSADQKAYSKVNMNMRGIIIADAYIMARKSTATGAFFKIVNTANTDDILLGVKQDPKLADRIEIHTTNVKNGTAEMYKVDSVVIPAQTMVQFKHGAYHVMIMGLQQPIEAAALYTLTLQFKNAGDIVFYIPALSASMIRNKEYSRDDRIGPQTRYDKK